MKRGELYLVRKAGSQDPRKQRVFVIVSRQALIDSRFSTLICAPIYSRHDGLSTQVRIGTDEPVEVGTDSLRRIPERIDVARIKPRT